MAFKAKDTIMHIRKVTVFSMRIIYRSGCNHPFIWCMLFFLLILYRYIPPLFGFVIYSLPVAVCTALVFGTLLLFVDSKVPYTVDKQNVKVPQEEQDTGDNKNSFSDGEDNESEKADVSDMIPILDELHPLLDIDAPQNAEFIDDSDDGSTDEEIENQEDEEDEANDDAHEVVLKWTDDDQKNLLDLGTSELERNQRLENLIAKRTARKFLSFHAERNLIDFDAGDPVTGTDNFQTPPISAPRKNPFDNIDEAPGSAPSILQPRQNPFDLAYGQNEDFILRPYFATESIEAEELPGFVSLEKEYSENDETNSVDRESEDHKEDVEVEGAEVIDEEEYDDSSSSSMEEIEEDSKVCDELGGDEQERDKSLMDPDDAVQSTMTEVTYPDDPVQSTTTEVVDDRQVAEPVYDSSPSAEPEDALSLEGKEEDLPNAESTWVASSRLSFIDRDESRTTEIDEISEMDVIPVTLSETGEDFVHTKSPVRLSPLLVSTVDPGAIINNQRSSNSSITGKPLTPRDAPKLVLQSERAGSNKITADLPPIFEENSENLEVEDENGSMTDESATSIVDQSVEQSSKESVQ
ncbi:uncharacterized protein LOC109820729 [Asparagus officinalis]|uniref:uncharacterized protein LOC109820729 n=1 Tax=Asparagus officinalis TaxID=4686 RepID=UPI00098E5905|nr:uncharacterized protein LOC109820729 [Asparagus officinalis]XP_020242514.1 uncharacterized protein LOC109820729 [Asparagus officinalis]XP_020242515.1 uncharacterized protein LOC109820729 [Asparagus officinalis]